MCKKRKLYHSQKKKETHIPTTTSSLFYDDNNDHFTHDSWKKKRFGLFLCGCFRNGDARFPSPPLFLLTHIRQHNSSCGASFHIFSLCIVNMNINVILVNLMSLEHLHVKSWTFLFENVNIDFTTRDTTNWYEANSASLKILTTSDEIYMYIVYYIERIYNISASMWSISRL